MIGDLFVDEAISIAYTYRSSDIPIYSYNKTTFSKVAKGRIIVQGSLVVNYVADDYISNILQSNLNRNMERAGTVGLADKVISRSKIEKVVEELKSKNNASLYSSMSATRKNSNIAKVLSLQPGERVQIMESLKQREQAKLRALKGEELSTQGRNTSVNQLLGNGPVNILVTHGNLNDPYNPVYRIIKNVHFIGLEHQTAPVGAVQTETYSFFAQDIM